MTITPIILEGSEDTPKIILDATNSIFEISGRSLPEDASDFYKPILKWINEYALEPNPKTEFVFKFEYFNTASSKLILDTLQKLKCIPNIKIIWMYYKADEDMLEAGEEFSELLEIDFDYKNY